jgi:D-xylose 1-dehydrogenase
MPQTTPIAAYADLRDQTIIITGGANGIGAAMVRAFHAQGARVHFCDVDEQAGAALAKELAERATFTRVDLTKENQIVRWVRKIGAPIQTLINNAARDPRIALDKTSAKDWDDLFATNLRAYFLMARETAPHMTGGGSIINFSSITIHTAPAAMSAYIATKGGAIAFTRSLASPPAGS